MLPSLKVIENISKSVLPDVPESDIQRAAQAIIEAEAKKKRKMDLNKGVDKGQDGCFCWTIHIKCCICGCY